MSNDTPLWVPAICVNCHRRGWLPIPAERAPDICRILCPECQARLKPRRYEKEERPVVKKTAGTLWGFPVVAVEDLKLPPPTSPPIKAMSLEDYCDRVYFGDRRN